MRTYFGKFASILNESNYIHKIEIYDLFCGPGIYPNGSNGSPVVLLMLFKEYFINSRKSNTMFHFYFNDKNETKIINLKQNLIKLNLTDFEDTLISFDNLSFSEYLHRLKPNHNSSIKRLFFIDPYGYKDFNISNIQTIMKDQNSEILFFVPLSFMYRFVSKGTPKVLLAILKDLNIDTKQLEKQYKFSQRNFIDLITNRLSNVLENYLVSSFSLKRSNNNLFTIFFFTSHILGLEKFNELKWQNDNKFGKIWDKFENDNFNIFEDVTFEPELKELTLKLESFLSDKRTNCELYYYTIQHGYLPKHVNLCLKEFEKDKRIEIVEFNDFKRRNKGFYINYDNYRQNFVKLFFKLI